MSSSIYTSLGTVQSGATTQSPASQAANAQPTVQQQLAEASLNGVYGPPYILDVSLAYAVGDTPLSGSPPAPIGGGTGNTTTTATPAPALPVTTPGTTAAVNITA